MLPDPIRVGPLIQQSPTKREPWPIVTSPEIVQRGPISTSSASSTSPSMMAVGWIFVTPRVYRLEVPDCHTCGGILSDATLEPMSSSRSNLASVAFEDLGRIGYEEALTIQRARHAAVVAARGADPGTDPQGLCILLVEHDPPVITLTRRPRVREHLLASPELLATRGVQLVETDRGGDITYHGPGQLVAYPILDLNLLGLRIHPYLRLLEEVIIRTLAAFEIQAGRDPDATGVWIDPMQPSARKIAALGVRLSRWCSMHGLALNVDPNLEHFGLIVPCGLHDRSVTSLRAELGDQCPSLDEVKQVLCREFQQQIAELIRDRARP